MKKYFSLLSLKTKVKCAAAVVLAAVGSLLASIWPVKLGELYTQISNGTITGLTQGLVPVLLFGGICFAAECITIFRRVMLDCVVSNHEAEKWISAVKKLLRMPVAFFEGSLKGEKTARLNQGITGLSQLIKIFCNDVLAALLTTAFAIGQVFLNAPVILSVVILMYLAVTFGISFAQIRSQNGIREKILALKNCLNGKICQAITNLEPIREMSAEDCETQRIKPDITEISKIEQHHHIRMGSFDCAKQAAKIVFQVILIIISVILIAAGKMESGVVITVCLLFQQLIKPIDDVYRFMDETASSLIKANILAEISESASDEIFEIAPGSAKTSDKSDIGIRFKDVVVTNPEKDKSIAHYDSVEIPAKSKVAIQGPNGCGKTSLVRSLTRYYPHISGEITIFGKEQSSYTQKELTNTIFYTQQVPFFVAGTVRENLLYGIDHEVSDKELISVLESVHLTGTGHTDTVLNTDPYAALDFYINEKVDELSGGMKQRLSLARALIRSPKLYIFDEITANLDCKSASHVLDIIEQHAADIGAGIVYISHDPTVVSRCSSVINLKNTIKAV